MTRVHELHFTSKRPLTILERMYRLLSSLNLELQTLGYEGVYKRNPEQWLSRYPPGYKKSRTPGLKILSAAHSTIRTEDSKEIA